MHSVWLVYLTRMKSYRMEKRKRERKEEWKSAYTQENQQYEMIFQCGITKMLIK